MDDAIEEGRVAARSRFGAGLALLHLGLAATVGLHLAIPFLLPGDARSDFGYFHASAVEAVRGGSPYVGTTAPVVNLNPPFQTVVMAPLGYLPYGPAMWIWYVLSLAAGVLAGFVTARAFLPERPLIVWGPALAMGLLLFLPGLANAWTAQFGFVLALGCACAFLLQDRGRTAAAGAVLGLLAGLKLFVGLVGVLFLLTARWRALLAFGLILTGTVILGGAVLGWASYLQYLELLGGVDWHAWSWNVSVFGTVTRLLGSDVTEGIVVHRPRLGLAVARALALGSFVGYALLVARRARSRSPVTSRLALSLTFVMMILLSPLGWFYYLPALLPCAAALVASSRPGRERASSAAAVAVFIASCLVPQKPYAGTELMTAGYEWWKAELPVLGLVVLAAAHVWRLLDPAGPAEWSSRSVRNGDPAAIGGSTPLSA